MPTRNIQKTVDRIVTRFYPNLTGPLRAERSRRVENWLRGKLGPYNRGYTTRELERMYQDETAGTDVLLMARPKLGTEKRANLYYILSIIEDAIAAGPYTKDEIDEMGPADGFKVITATFADRKGYLRKYVTQNEKNSETE